MNCTYMWREYPFIRGDKSYRFQTNDSAINKRMRQRKDFKLAMWGLNNNIWVYITEKNTANKARRTLSNITQGPVKKTSERGVYVVKTVPYIASK